MSFLLITETFEELDVAADTAMLTSTPSTALAAPVSAIPTTLVSVVPTVPVFSVLTPTIPTTPIPTVPIAQIPAIPTAPILVGSGMFSSSYPFPYFFIINSSFSLYGFSHHALCSLSGLVLTAPSQFEVGSSSATIPNPMSEAVAFFTRFDQPEVNDLNLADFWGAGPPYVNFHGF